MTSKAMQQGFSLMVVAWGRPVFWLLLSMALFFGMAGYALALDDSAVAGDVAAFKAGMQQKIATENQEAGISYATGLESAKKNCDITAKAGADQGVKDSNIWLPGDPSKALKTGTCLDTIMNMKVGFGLSLPGVQQIIDAIINYIINKACALVMAEWNKVVGDIQGAINTNIDAPFGLGGASVGIGGQSGVNILGMGSDPSQLVSVKQTNPNLTGALDSLTGLGNVSGGTNAPVSGGTSAPVSGGTNAPSGLNGGGAQAINSAKSAGSGVYNAGVDAAKSVGSQAYKAGADAVKSVGSFLGVGNN